MAQFLQYLSGDTGMQERFAAMDILDGSDQILGFRSLSADILKRQP